MQLSKMHGERRVNLGDMPKWNKSKSKCRHHEYLVKCTKQSTS